MILTLNNPQAVLSFLRVKMIRFIHVSNWQRKKLSSLIAISVQFDLKVLSYI